MKQRNLLREFSLSLPEATEEPHFEKISFRVKNKIFATFDERNNRATLKLSKDDQFAFSAIDEAVIYPVSNKWGKQGWTVIELDKADDKILRGALVAAYCEVAPKKLAGLVQKKL